MGASHSAQSPDLFVVKYCRHRLDSIASLPHCSATSSYCGTGALYKPAVLHKDTLFKPQK